MSKHPTLDPSLGRPADGLLTLSTWTQAELAAAGVADAVVAEPGGEPSRLGLYSRSDAATRTRLVANAHRDLEARGVLAAGGPQAAELALLRAVTAPKQPSVNVQLSGDHDTGRWEDGGSYTLTGHGARSADGSLWVVGRWVDPFADTVAVTVRSPERFAADVLVHLHEHGSPAAAPLHIAQGLFGTLRPGRFKPTVSLWDLHLYPNEPLSVGDLSQRPATKRTLDAADAERFLVDLITSTLD